MPIDLNDVKALPDRPGIYRMLDSEGNILYIGKAKSLKKRVGSYFKPQQEALKTRLLVEKIADIQVTLTETEAEALLLEQTLIKQHKPYYNILLKDDKSYPSVYLSDHRFPRISAFRGPRNKSGTYYGPFVSGTGLRDTLNVIQKVFRVRQCEDTFFRNRTRPCLQYQINRCTAPCVDYVTAQAYQEQIRMAQDFLEGRKSDQLIATWVHKMEAAAERLDFELATQLRDQIAQLKAVQAKQQIVGQRGELDTLAIVMIGDLACISVVHIRKGQVVGHENHLLRSRAEEASTLVLSAFLPQYYLAEQRIEQIPEEIILPQALEDQQLILDVLESSTGKKVRLTHKVRQSRAAWLKLAALNAQQHIELHLAKQSSQLKRLEQLQADLGYESSIEQLECFDISHTQGEKTQASCVVFDQAGPVKRLYRRYNIRDITPGDDYAAINQAVYRRYKQQKTDDACLPQVILIDGGKGQLTAAKQSLEECQIDTACLLAIAKGPERKAGLETLFRLNRSGGLEEVSLSTNALLLLQQIRDEAHRFAISGHRNKRDKQRRQSILEGIPGVGPKRRKQLLTHFGGLQGLKKASTQDLAIMKGISPALAAEIVDFLRET